MLVVATGDTGQQGFFDSAKKMCCAFCACSIVLKSPAGAAPRAPLLFYLETH